MTSVKIKLVNKKIEELIPAPYNPRYMTEKQRAGLEYSIDTFGIVEPIVWNKTTGHIVGGHQRYEKLVKDGVTDVDVVEVELSDEKEKALNIALNHKGISGEFDQLHLEYLLSEINDKTLFEGLNFDDFKFEDDTLPEDGEEAYTRKITPPVYIPKNKKPAITELFDMSKVKKLMAKIDKAAIAEEEKDFLKAAAMRHCVFNYAAAADYYAYANKEVQDLMEDSALVIIDFNKAIENGFVVLAKELLDLYDESVQ